MAMCLKKEKSKIMLSLKNTLLANAASCIIFGIIFVTIPNIVATFLSEEAPVTPIILKLLGGILIFNGLHLTWAAKRENLHKLWIIYFSTGDFLWTLGTAILITSNLWITDINGVIASIITSIIVATFGGLQIKHLLKK